MTVLTTMERKYLESLFPRITDYVINQWYGFYAPIRDPETAELYRSKPGTFSKAEKYVNDIGLGVECILAERVETVKEERDNAIKQLLSCQP